MTIGEKIKELRQSKNYSQGKLALKLDVHRNHVSLWETDKYEPSISYCIALANIFDVTLDELCCRGERTNEQNN